MLEVVANLPDSFFKIKPPLQCFLQHMCTKPGKPEHLRLASFSLPTVLISEPSELD